jgi:TolA-binding protein
VTAVRRTRLAWLVAAAAAGVAAVVAVHAQAPPTPEDVARRQYASGLEFLRAGRHIEALKDFQTVVDSYPGTSVADEALLAIARYELEIARDAVKAQGTAESVLKRFPASDSVAMAYVVAGQAMVQQGLTQANVDAALASFDRVPRLFPGTPAVAPALSAAGETLRRLGRCDEALDRFGKVVLEYPRSLWSARARMSSAKCLALAGRVPEAMGALYRVSATSPGTESAVAARTLGTILNRLYVRPPAQPAFVPAERSLTGPGGRLRDVKAIAIAPDGSVYVAGRAGISVLDTKGLPLRAAAAGEIRDMALDARGRAVGVQRALVVQETGRPPASLVTLTVPPSGGGAARVLDDLSAIAVLSSGDWLVADRSARGVYRFSPAGKYIGPFASGRIARIAVDPSDNVALLDGDARTVSIHDRTGKAVTRIAAKGTGYALADPSDLEFDPLGYLYVLDRASVLVFAPRASTPLVTFADQRATGGFRNARALAVDEAARLYIYDDSAERVLVYQ